MARFRDRSTGEIMVMMVAATVCGSVVVGMGAIIIVSIINPDFDEGEAARQVSDLLNTLVGLLAGFLAGRTDSAISKMKNQEPPEDQR